MFPSPTASQFPAVLMAGAPHCGKSVLAFMLSQQLREMNTVHYLLRVAPDGEGDWFLQGDPDHVRPLRQKHKSQLTYSADYVAYMKNTIENRLVPLLVDAGGLPRGEQFGILRACTHAILLYKDEEGRAEWRRILSEQGLPLIAELRSTLQTPGALEKTQPYLMGSISGLDRDQRQTDATFGAVLVQVAGLFHYDAMLLEKIHLRYAQYEPLVERLLMEKISPERQGISPHWEPEDLSAIPALVAPEQAFSLYGRGPVWLAAMLGAHAKNAPMTIYGVSDGWLPVPTVREQAFGGPLTLQISAQPDYDFVDISCGILAPEELTCPPLPGEKAVVISGKLPRWAFAALARWLAPQKNWVAIYDAAMNGAIVVSSRVTAYPVGTVIPIIFDK